MNKTMKIVMLIGFILLLTAPIWAQDKTAVTTDSVVAVDKTTTTTVEVVSEEKTAEPAEEVVVEEKTAEPAEEVAVEEETTESDEDEEYFVNNRRSQKVGGRSHHAFKGLRRAHLRSRSIGRR